MSVPQKLGFWRLRPSVFLGLARLVGQMSSRHSLSRRVLFFTLFFVMLAEILVYVPSVVQVRNRWFDQRLTAARVASIALETRTSPTIEAKLEAELLANAGVLTVAVLRDDSRILILSDPIPRNVTKFYNFDKDVGFRINSVIKTFHNLFAGEGHIARVVDTPHNNRRDVIEIVVDLAPLQEYLTNYSVKLLSISLFVLVAASGLIYFNLYWFLVRPMRRITGAIAEFRRAPETPQSIITPSNRKDEIGIAERELAAMQLEVHNALHQKERLAALGAAVTRINHDLRNILASGQILTEQLFDSQEPKVKRLTPRILGAFARAIGICVNTLKFSQTEENTPRRSVIPLAKLVDEIGDGLPLAGPPAIRYVNRVDPTLCLDADREYLLRIFLNLTRNAMEAMQEIGTPGELYVDAELVNSNSATECFIRLTDTGPGLPRRVIENLFQPFTGYGRAQGTGLGLAISRELARAHGGDIKLEHSGALGSCFLVVLPYTLKLETREYAQRLARAGE